MKNLILTSILFLFISCNNDKVDSKTDLLLKNVESSFSGIDFKNEVVENQLANYKNFEYVFNGGGVAVGDINNDGLEDIYFSSNQGSNKLYLNKGNLKFEDITESAGVEALDGWKFGVNMVDINRDGLLDIYVCRSGWPNIDSKLRENLLYINKGNNEFVESAKSYGLNENSYSIHSSFFDYDNDGDLDCYITAHPVKYNLSVEERMEYQKNPPRDQEDKFYENVNGTYKEVTYEKGLKSYGHGLGVVTSDINKDGYVDIYVTNDYRVPDYMYINQGDGTFKNEIHTRLGHMSFFSMGVDIADINKDGYEDIFVTEMLPTDYKRSKTNMASMNVPEFENMLRQGLGYQYMHNTLQLNRRGEKFSEISQLSGVNKSDWSWGCLLDDLDNDGKRDIYVANGYKRDYMNQDYIKEVSRLATVNNNKLDLETMNSVYKSFKPQNAIFIQSDDYKFKKQSKSLTDLKATNSQSIASADFDNDGDLDIVINNLDEVATLLENKSSNNYIQIDLKPIAPGLDYNAKIYLTTDSVVHYFEFKPVRGYQAKVSDIITFGLGETESINSIRVEWLNGKESIVKDVKANQRIEIEQKNSLSKTDEPSITNVYNFNNSDLLTPAFLSKELVFDDYKNQVLLPHRYSRMGPFMSKGDADGDGKEDIYVGGARGFEGQLYLQTAEGYKLKRNPDFSQGKEFEDMGSVFVDFDNDGDQDLYVVSGGNELKAKDKVYKDRLYINDGNANFSISSGLIPEIPTSGSCVIKGDIDNDGDQDLFVGGRIFPNHYPLPTPSMLLMNQNGKYVDMASKFDLDMLGLITDAVFSDVNKDGLKDLLVVGEWIGVKVFLNSKTGFKKSNSELEASTKGWWKSIQAVDLDGYGDDDYIVGNKGLNSKYSASHDNPFYVYSADFDNSGTYDMFLAKTLKEDKRLVPVRGRQCSSEQMPGILDKFETYADFADANLDEIINIDENTVKYEANQLGSVVLENINGALSPKLLPVEVQFSEVNSIVVRDMNNDGLKDLILAGNNDDTEAETSKTDASIGSILINKGDLNFEHVPDHMTNLNLSGNVKDMMLIGNHLLVSKNMGKLESFVIQ